MFFNSAVAQNLTNFPFFGPSSSLLTVNTLTSAGSMSVVAVAFADLVFVDVVMMTFLSCWTLLFVCLFVYLFIYLFIFSRWALSPTRSTGAKTNEKSFCSPALILVDSRKAVLCVVIVLLVARRGYIIVMALTMGIITL